MLDENAYYEWREALLADTQHLIERERYFAEVLARVIGGAAARIAHDFDQSHIFRPFWVNYPPLQRGRAPSGQSVPWQELGETSIGAHVIRAIGSAMPAATHPGLPSGADIRFMIDDVLIHLDIKMTGPNDNPHEVVASPNQISGDGSLWANGGVINGLVTVVGQRQVMLFQPELAPFYIVDGKRILCLTYFLKGIYTVEDNRSQPLRSLELICCPNGLLAFANPDYNRTVPGLFIPGKDEQGKPKKRVRVRIEMLRPFAVWRRQRVWERP